MIYRNDPKRKAPALSATSASVGTRMRGQDGKMHVVVANCHGVHRWKALSTGESSKKRTPSAKSAKRTTPKAGSVVRKRSAPVSPARAFSDGTTRKGADNRFWAVKRTKTGHKRWVRVPASKREQRTPRASPPRRKRSPAGRGTGQNRWARSTGGEKRQGTGRGKAPTHAHWEPTVAELEKLAVLVTGDTHPYLKLSTKARQRMAKVAIPLVRELARSDLHRALSHYFGDAKDLIENALKEASKAHSTATKSRAVVEYLFAELSELAGNEASESGTITPKDVLVAMREDSELLRLIEYT
jgi:hypothetical protein